MFAIFAIASQQDALLEVVELAFSKQSLFPVLHFGNRFHLLTPQSVYGSSMGLL